ncbi:MAG: ATP-binding cassette domain-containing protein [Silicimonas sp.]|nr:ATP-binding cassette domain-containing protein [Silicimonas sp.]
MGSLRISKICKSFGPAFALKDVTLTVAPGQRLGVLGPEGAGKSTLLQIAAGLIEPEFGTVERGDPPCQVAYLCGDAPLPPRDSCERILLRPLRRQLLNWPERLPGLAAVLAPGRSMDIVIKMQVMALRLGLQPHLGQRAANLGPEDRLRLRLAEALVCEPDVLLLDEPLAELPREARPALLADLVALQRDLGVTMLLASRDETDVRAFSTCLAVLKDGRLLQSGPPDALHDDPDNLDVARMLGKPPICLLPGVLDRTGTLTLSGQPVGRFRAPTATPVQVGLRPEAVRISATGAGAFSGIVVDHQRVGLDLFLHIDLSDQDLRVIARAPQDPRAWPPIEARVRFDLDPRELLLFEQNGARLRLPELLADRTFA